MLNAVVLTDGTQLLRTGLPEHRPRCAQAESVGSSLMPRETLTTVQSARSGASGKVAARNTIMSELQCASPPLQQLTIGLSLLPSAGRLTSVMLAAVCMEEDNISGTEVKILAHASCRERTACPIRGHLRWLVTGTSPLEAGNTMSCSAATCSGIWPALSNEDTEERSLASSSGSSASALKAPFRNDVTSSVLMGQEVSCSSLS
mmetsp:Transcript_18065/g.47127  ORF Transcript_18065/g.47127 Transcript_18065/m.47127 type:complete len:204 (-) Transcript_18065:1518-2129(-)